MTMLVLDAITPPTLAIAFGSELVRMRTTVIFAMPELKGQSCNLRQFVGLPASLAMLATERSSGFTLTALKADCGEPSLHRRAYKCHLTLCSVKHPAESDDNRARRVIPCADKFWSWDEIFGIADSLVESQDPLSVANRGVLALLTVRQARVFDLVNATLKL